MLFLLAAHQCNDKTCTVGETCLTKPGKGVGKTPCVFPWKYEDGPTLYNGCADPDKSGYLWCPTELDEEGKYISGKWGVCEYACQDDPTEYNGCANPNMSEEGLWCPTKLDEEGYYVSGHWGACLDSCPGNVLNLAPMELDLGGDSASS